MRTVKFTEFRNNTSFYFSKAENGETIRIIRHGKVIAEIIPSFATSIKTPSWKKKGKRLLLEGKSLSSVIIEERESY